MSDATKEEAMKEVPLLSGKLLTRDGQKFLLVLDKKCKGELPLFLCEEINKSIHALLTAKNGFPDRVLKKNMTTAKDCGIKQKEVLETAAVGAPVPAAMGSFSPSSQYEPSVLSILEKQSSETTMFPSMLSNSKGTVVNVNANIDADIIADIDVNANQAAINNIADSFLGSVENAVQKLLCDEFSPEREARGLYEDWFDEKKNCGGGPFVSRGAIEEMERSLSRQLANMENQDPMDDTGATATPYSLKSVSLVPLLAKLGAELGGRFQEEEEEGNTKGVMRVRGGLLSKDLDGVNALQNLCIYPWVYFSEEQQRLCDETILGVLETLRNENMLTRDDIREHNLVGKLFCLSASSLGGGGGGGSGGGIRERVFPERRFRFLSDWDPTILTRPIGSFPFGSNSNNNNRKSRKHSRLPIHWSIGFSSSRDIRAFSVVFEAGMKHYPEKLGFVFTKQKEEGAPYNQGGRGKHKHKHKHKLNQRGYGGAGAGAKRIVVQCDTPYVEACKKYGAELVTTEVLNRIAATTTTTTTNCAEPTTPEGFLLSAVADKTMDWSGLHLLLQNFPGALSRTASTKSTTPKEDLTSTGR
eukprot:CAMPEP_0168296916 /NCGR_PEP_ID=MMETSP0142_2-20121227/17391_1 /TAXON_ID=44445 /ORGANISM="Pseudo-nitzschia australis, Strain 10249 10 AB" /LENGTH=584 /DNA_ID=CAMNT_0008245995 /DNA_START=334 /DNA_END=2086 /DNA_ORIENTATION=+